MNKPNDIARVGPVSTGSVAEVTLDQWVYAPIPEAVAYFAYKTGISPEHQRKLARILEAARQHEREPQNPGSQP